METKIIIILSFVLIVIIGLATYFTFSSSPEDYTFMVLNTETNDLGEIETDDYMKLDSNSIVVKNLNFTEKVCSTDGTKCITAEKWNFLFAEGGIYDRREELARDIATANNSYIETTTGEWRGWVHARSSYEAKDNGIFFDWFDRLKMGVPSVLDKGVNTTPKTSGGDVKFSPVGHRVISTDLSQRRVIVFNVADLPSTDGLAESPTIKIVKSLYTSYTPRRLAYSPDGSMIAVVASEADKNLSQVRVWNAHTFNEIMTVERTDRFKCLAFSRNSDTIAAGTWGGKIVILNPNTGGELRTITAFTADEFTAGPMYFVGVEALDFSPIDDTVVAVSGTFSNPSNATARTFSAESGNKISETAVNGTYAYDVQFNPLGTEFAVSYSGADSRYVVRWDASSGNEVRAYGVPEYYARVGTRLVYTDNHIVVILRPDGSNSVGQIAYWFPLDGDPNKVAQVWGGGNLIGMAVPKTITSSLTEMEEIPTANSYSSSDLVTAFGSVDPKLRYASISDLGDIAFDSLFKVNEAGELTWDGEGEIARIVLDNFQSASLTDGDHDFWSSDVSNWKRMWTDNPTSFSQINSDWNIRLRDYDLETFKFVDTSGQKLRAVDTAGSIDVASGKFRTSKTVRVGGKMCIEGGVCIKNTEDWRNRIKWLTGASDFDGPTLSDLINETNRVYDTYVNLYNMMGTPV